MKAYEAVMDVALDGRDDPITVYVDQRDFAAWEIRPEAENERAWVFTRSRFVVWHAAKRAGQYSGTWPEFNERDAIQVKDHPKADAETESEAQDDAELEAPKAS